MFTHTGDVEIVINNGRKHMRYLLHKLILTQCSGFFEAGTSDEWATAGDVTNAGPSNGTALSRIPSGSRPEQKRKWRYEMDWGSGDDDLPMLVQKVRCLHVHGVRHTNEHTEESAYNVWRRPKSTSTAA